LSVGGLRWGKYDMEDWSFRIEKLEGGVDDLREELHIRYLDKYQTMNEYLSRRENEKYLDKMVEQKRQWPIVVGGVVVAASSVVSVILQVIGH
jgi:hypothetical protein